MGAKETGTKFATLSLSELRKKEDALDQKVGKHRSDFFFYTIATTISGVLITYGMFGNWLVIALVVLGVVSGYFLSFTCYRRWQVTKEQLAEVRKLIADKRSG